MGFSCKSRWLVHRYFRFLTTATLAQSRKIHRASRWDFPANPAGLSSRWHGQIVQSLARRACKEIIPGRVLIKQASKLESIAQHLGSVVEAYERSQLSQSCLPFRTFCGGFRVFSSGVFVFEVHVVVRFRPFEFLSSLKDG